jgi:enoyl-CoA hydratase/carnithine racemase
MMSVGEATPLLDGWAQSLRPTGYGDVVVIDLDDDRGGSLALPDHLPNVVVGVGTPRRNGSEAGVDVALTLDHDAPRPWVTVNDMTEMLGLISSTVKGCPLASAMFVQVLRSGAGMSVGQGLLLESLAYSTLQAGPEFRAWLATRTPLEPSDSPDSVLVSRHGSQLSVVLNRPQVHNAYNAAIREQLCDALAVALSDPSVEEVILSGAGPSFCSGGDLSEFGTAADPASAHLIRFGRSPGRLLARLSGRVTAHLHGFCVGSGIEIPAFAGRIQAHPETLFQLPELSMGLIPGAGGTVSLPRRIGRQRTAWLGLSGRRIGAGLALKWALIDEILPTPDTGL